MTWLRIDDGMVDHRKWAALEEDPRTWSECLAVWMALASYCARVSSDGFVEDARIGRLTPLGARARQRCDDLVRVGLMEREEGGYRFHDWLDYQPSAADVTRDREAARIRQKRAREEARSRRESRDPSRRDIHRDSRGTETVSHGPPVPTRPDPSTLATRESGARAPEVPTSVEVEPKVRAAIGEAQRAEAARARLAPVWRERTGATPMELSALTPKAEVVSALAGLPDEPELSGVLDRFFDDPKMRERGWPIQWLLRNPAQWSGRAGAKGGHAPPRKNHEYEARSMTFDELMNEREVALGGGSHG